jgi:UPF0755 protein
MKKKALIKTALILLLCLFSYEVYNIFIKTTHFGKESIVFEYKNNGLSSLADTLVAKKIILDKPSFMLLAKLFNVEAKAKPGKYLVKKNMSLLGIIRMLRNNQQATVNLVLNKVRTRGDLSKLIQNTLSIDSATAYHFFSNNNELAPYGVDTTTLLTLMLPNTYTMYWSTSLPNLMQKMKAQKDAFWKSNNRLEQAKKIGMTPNEVYTLASIVEEECNYDSDKSLIASVYQNRLNKEMPLQACPTIKYAMQNFTLTRIYEKYLTNPSPYNTYNHKGLPPGPICTPSMKTIDLVLNAPTTNYLYFVAKADFSGYHHFSTTYDEHNKFAKEYQLKLDEYQKKKKN